MLLEALKAQLSNGLIRRASTTCGRWATNYINMGKPIPGPLRFQMHPWSEEFFNHNGDWVGMKAAQMGMSTAAIARSLWTIDIKRVDVLYILPKRTPDAADFSKSKFDPIVESSPHISELFSNVKNIGHKQAGSVNLYIRGSRSRSALKSISVGLMVYDEFDEMVIRNLILADERDSGYTEADKQKIKISTPTVPDHGIDLEIQNTTRELYNFKCPSCNRFTTLEYPECLVITTESLLDETNLRKSHLICKECKIPLSHEAKPTFLSKTEGALWVPANPNAYDRGFEINQLYSCVMPPWKIARLALKAQDSPEAEQELWNSKVAKAHLVAGAKVDTNLIKACYGSHKNGSEFPRGLITMGVDVGKFIHYKVSQWLLPEAPGSDLNTHAIKRVLRVGKVRTFEELDTLMYEYQVLQAVVDANPETRKAQEFADRFPGKVHLCYFVHTVDPKRIRMSETSSVISIRRTSWLDLSQGRFRKAKAGIILPYDVPEEYIKHICSLARVSTKDSDGNPVNRYVTTGTIGDHYAFANLYDEVALPLAVSRTNNTDVSIYL